MAHCERLLADGADILDIGGESTARRCPPLTKSLSACAARARAAVQLGVPVSVDTCKAGGDAAAIAAGADIINDIWALRPGRQRAVVATRRPGRLPDAHAPSPQTMQVAPWKDDVAPGGSLFWRTQQACGAGAAGPHRLGRGHGFGKDGGAEPSVAGNSAHCLALWLHPLAGWAVAKRHWAP